MASRALRVVAPFLVVGVLLLQEQEGGEVLIQVWRVWYVLGGTIAIICILFSSFLVLMCHVDPSMLLYDSAPEQLKPVYDAATQSTVVNPTHTCGVQRVVQPHFKLPQQHSST